MDLWDHQLGVPPLIDLDILLIAILRLVLLFVLIQLGHTRGDFIPSQTGFYIHFVPTVLRVLEFIDVDPKLVQVHLRLSVSIQ